MSWPSSPSAVQSGTSPDSFQPARCFFPMLMEYFKKMLTLLGLSSKLVLLRLGLSSVSPRVLPHLIGLDTSTHIWNSIVVLH
ncbi:hypothetical protein PVK06_010051 [Gossypium arboreum]|uniref:Uncharacterized protein n=1 Tax=Gossypium arboreum TaxID=29729 RepID=A0ABR0QQF7_GOSAR|nr:hypothetical protein PVK06_010051 [Gossypium arboreum]